MIVRKDIFRTGRTPSGERFTRDDVVSAFRNAKRLINSKHPHVPPLIWEHDAEEGPVSLASLAEQLRTDRDKRARWAQNTFGGLIDVELVEESDGPVLYGHHYIQNKADAEAWAAAKYCSPRILWDCKDDQGREFPGANIFHVAATTRPVQTKQKPVSLSHTPTGSKWTFRRAYTLSETIMADGNKGGNPGKSSHSQRIKTALSSLLGFDLPDTVDSEEKLADALEVLAAQRGGMSEPGGEGEEGMEGEETDPNANPGGTGATTSMSGSAGTMLSDTENAARQQLVAVTRKQIMARFDKVEGPAALHQLRTPVQLRDLRDKLTGVNLSWDMAGNLQRNRHLQELADLEASVRAINAAMPKGNRGKGTGKTVPVNLSDLNNPGSNVAAAKAFAKKLCEDNGVPYDEPAKK